MAVRLADYIGLMSPRKVQVWKLMATSHNTKQIAGMLGIDKTTVQWHRKELERVTKMNLAQLTCEAIRIGLIEL